MTQKQALVKSLKKIGYHEELLKDLRLKDLKAIANDEDVGYFHMTKYPEELDSVLVSELQRLGIGANLSKALEYLRIEEWDTLYNCVFRFKIGRAHV